MNVEWCLAIVNMKASSQWLVMAERDREFPHFTIPISNYVLNDEFNIGYKFIIN